MAHILVVDDESKITNILEALLTDAGHQVTTSGSTEDALEIFATTDFDGVLTDLSLPGKSGLDLLESVKNDRPDIQVVMMTAYGTVKTAVEAMRLGAFHYVTKPFDNDEIVLTMERALDVNALTRKVQNLEGQLHDRFRFESLLGESSSWTGVLEVLDRLARVDGPVLILGESGTGKERVARGLHEASKRRSGPLETVNCGAIPESLVESTFFGHKKGAFTGADQDHIGCFERAHGGTLFLDEIGELPLNAQVKLLRVLQEEEVVPVGGDEPRKIDVRVLAATNRSLENDVSDGRFREDLFYRLNVLAVELPPLRKRLGDVLLLVDYFFQFFNKKEDLRVVGFSKDTRELMEKYPWPGNVRELENTLYSAMVMAQGREVLVDDLPQRIQESSGVDLDLETWVQTSGELSPIVDQAVREIEIQVIRERLKVFEGSKTKTAESLGMSRKTLFNKMKLYNMEG